MGWSLTPGKWNKQMKHVSSGWESSKTIPKDMVTEQGREKKNQNLSLNMSLKIKLNEWHLKGKLDFYINLLENKNA